MDKNSRYIEEGADNKHLRLNDIKWDNVLKDIAGAIGEAMEEESSLSKLFKK